mgnify:CR=1 FL=1|tara:strand:- start:1407 stop:1841 length:435 start_codon:yes stop_codon:yes gene_type:complete
MSEDKKIRIFELKKGLFISSDNYEMLAKAYDKAVQKKKKGFLFRNHEGKLYKIECAYMEFVLKTLQESDHKELIDKANAYKKHEQKLTKEEFEEYQERVKKQHEVEQTSRDRTPKIWNMDGQVINKKTSEQLKKPKTTKKNKNK